MIGLEPSSDILIFDLYLKTFVILGNVDFYLRKNLFEFELNLNLFKMFQGQFFFSPCSYSEKMRWDRG